jgi:hypothetical protein
MLRLPSLLLVTSLVLVCGCSRLTRLQTDLLPPDQPLPAAQTLKAHLLDGGVVVFSSYVDTPEGVHGTAVRYDASRTLVTSGELVVPRDSVALFEASSFHAGGATGALLIVSGISAAVTVFCLIDSKACFGSCPTFYAPGTEGDGVPERAAGPLALRAEGYSSSIAPALEAADVDDLARTAGPGEPFMLRMTNEALETHVTRHADLLAVPRPAGARAYFAGSGTDGAEGGRFVVALAEQAPHACAGPEGDCLQEVSEALDGRERTRPANPSDLAARETVDFVFDGFDRAEGSAAGAPLGLVIAARQSLVTTFLFYQMLAYMGDDAGAWMAQLERAARAEAAEGGRFRPGLSAGLGGIEVEAWDGAEWRQAGVLDEHGPLAIDLHIVPLPDLPPGPVHVRLRMAEGLWRLDAVRLAALGADASPVRIPPHAVEREHADADPSHDADALAALRDPARHLVTLPGAALRLYYALPEGLPAEAAGWDLFLESRGYYLEWLREEWRAEADPAALAQILYEPEAALRALAPAFKQLEPVMEAAFWGSRYAAPSRPPLP